MRRFLTVLLSLGLVLGLGAIRSLVAQDEEPASASPASEAPQEGQDESKTEPEAPAPAASSSADELPPEVQEKREAALKAVAELIVAAEKAGLVQTNVEPPPILDVLVLGKSTDKADLEAASGNAETQVGLVNPEAFAAYFTGYAEPPEGLTAQANVRIRQPSEGLKDFFDKRADALRPYLDAARSASSGETETEAAPAEEPKAEEPAPAPAEEPKEETKKDEAPAEEPKAEEPAPAEEPEVPVSPEPAPAEPKEEPKDEPKAEEPKAEEPKEEPKAEEPKEEPKAEEPKAEEPSNEEPESDEPN